MRHGTSQLQDVLGLAVSDNASIRDSNNGSASRVACNMRSREGHNNSPEDNRLDRKNTEQEPVLADQTAQ